MKQERLTQLYIAVLMTAYLLWTGPGGYGKITYYKTSAFLICTGCYGALMGLLCLKDRPVQGRRPGVVSYLVMGYWLFTALSTLFAVDRERAFFGASRGEGLLTISAYCLCFLLLARWARPRAWMVHVFGAGVGCNCLVALVQLAGYNPFALYPAGLSYYDGLIRYGGQFLGTVGNVDLLSALLCVAVPVFWIALLRLEGSGRFWLLIPLGLSVAVLCLMWVEGGILGVGGSFVLGVWVVLKKPRHRKIAAAAGVFCLAGALAGIWLLGGRGTGFVFEAHELLHGRFDENFGSGRLYIWRESWALLSERLLLGGGPETLSLRLSAAFERFDPELGGTVRSVVDVAHNEYLNILVNQGLGALVCYLGALVSGAVGWIRRAPAFPAAAIWGGGVLGYCVQAFFGISSPITAPFFWMAFGLLTGELDRK